MFYFPAFLMTFLLMSSMASPSYLVQANGNAITHTKSQGVFIGNRLQSSKVDEYLNVPFAQPPVGNLRFSKTQSIKPYTQSVPRNATVPGPICIQPPSGDSTTSQIQSEDCLQLNIYKPSNIGSGRHLPVMFWLYGGSWQEGSINQARINATNFIKRSIELNEPVIWVAANYRVGAFGFLPGQAIIDAQKTGQAILNAGIWDQREALKWIQRNIEAFGGDPSRVILYGESAGAANVGHHLMANKGKGSIGLFRGAILESGNAATGRRLPSNHPEAEAVYQYVLNGSGCSNSTSSSEQIECLKQKTTKEITAGNNLVLANSYIGYQPTLDDYFIQEYPSIQWSKQQYLQVPFITGDNLDEGTEFPYPTTVTNDQDFKKAQVFALGQSIEPIFDQILQTWSSDPKQGEPYRPDYFGVSASDTFYPPNGTNQYKRQASMFQDIYFEAGRHLQLRSAVQAKIPSWSYRFAQASPVGVGMDAGIAKASMGVQHEAEIPFVFANPPLQGSNEINIPQPLRSFASDKNLQQVSNAMSAAWIHFAYRLNPNGKDVPSWQQYKSKIDHFGDGQELYIQANNFSMTSDNLEQRQVQFVIDHRKNFYI